MNFSNLLVPFMVHSEICQFVSALAVDLIVETWVICVKVGAGIQNTICDYIEFRNVAGKPRNFAQ
jgi:hypothetical protein